jgi:hypothetical protein
LVTDRTRWSFAAAFTACVLVAAEAVVAQQSPPPAPPAAAEPPAAPPPPCDPLAELARANQIVSRAKGRLTRWVGGAKCDVADTSGIKALKLEWQALQQAFDYTTCARSSTDGVISRTGAKAHRVISDVNDELVTAVAHMTAQQAVADANQALANARKSRTVEDAKALSEAADKHAAEARDQLAHANDVCTQRKVTAAETAADLAREQVTLRESGPDSLCGANDLGLPQSICGIFGISAAALSYLWAVEGDGVRSGRRLTTVGVPAGAFRYVLMPWVAIDLGGYSAFLTKSLASTSPSVDKVSCAQSPTEYENRLPCEATNEMYAYLAGYAGLTVGRKGVGFVTLQPLTVGIAQRGTSPTLVPYFGISVGVLQVNGTF